MRARRWCSSRVSRLRARGDTDRARRSSPHRRATRGGRGSHVLQGGGKDGSRQWHSSCSSRPTTWPNWPGHASKQARKKVKGIGQGGAPGSLERGELQTHLDPSPTSCTVMSCLCASWLCGSWLGARRAEIRSRAATTPPHLPATHINTERERETRQPSTPSG